MSTQIIDIVLDTIREYPVFLTVKSGSTGESGIYLVESPDEVEDLLKDGDTVQEYDYDTGTQTPENGEDVLDEDGKNEDLLKDKCPLNEDDINVSDPDDPNSPENQKILDEILADDLEDTSPDVIDDEI